MATPITWRNINAPDFSGSAAMMESGSQALQGGLDKLMQLGRDYQARQEQAWEKGTERNNNAILQDLLSAKTIDEYDGIMGGLKERVAAMGGQVDATDIMQRAIQGRADLQNRTKTDAEFADFQLREEWKPITTQVQSLIAANQHDKAAEVLRTSGIPEQLQSALWRSLEQDQQNDQTFKLGVQQKQLGMAHTRQQMNQAATEFDWKKNDRLTIEAIKNQTNQINNDIDSGLQSGKDPSVVLLDAERKAREWNAQNPNAPVDMDAIYERYGKRFGDIERLNPVQERALEQQTNEVAGYFDQTINSIDEQLAAVDADITQRVAPWMLRTNSALSEGDALIEITKIMGALDPMEEINIEDVRGAMDSAQDEIVNLVNSSPEMKKYLVNEKGKPIAVTKKDISPYAVMEIIKRAGIDMDDIFLPWDRNDLNDEKAEIAALLANSDFAAEWAEGIKLQQDAEKAKKELKAERDAQEKLKEEALYQTKETAINVNKLLRQQRNN